MSNKILCDYCGRNDYPNQYWDMTIDRGINKIICPRCKEQKRDTVDYCNCPDCIKIRDKQLGIAVGAWDK